MSVESTAPGLDGTGIAARFPDSRLDYLAGARWPVRTPTLIESALIEALQDSGRLRSVQSGFGRLRTTHSLSIEVRRFEADYTGGEIPVAQVALAVTVGTAVRPARDRVVHGRGGPWGVGEPRQFGGRRTRCGVCEGGGGCSRAIPRRDCA